MINKETDKKKYSVTLISILIILTAVFINGCANIGKEAKNRELIPIKVKLSWLHTAEFSGMYIAKSKGYYEEKGLDVSFEAFDFENNTMDYVYNGNAEIGITSGSELIQSRVEGGKIKAIFAIFKKSPVILISLESSNIIKPADLNGKIIGLDCGGNGEIDEKAFLKRYNINYTKACSDYNLQQLIDKKVDASSGFLTNEPPIYESQGYKINYVLLSDYGVMSYPNLIFAREDYILKNPEIISGFIAATEKGMEYSIENPEEAVDETLKYDAALNRENQLKTMSIQSPLIFDGTTHIGVMEKSIFEYTQNTLIKEGIIETAINLDDIYTNEFIGK